MHNVNTLGQTEPCHKPGRVTLGELPLISQSLSALTRATGERRHGLPGASRIAIMLPQWTEPAAGLTPAGISIIPSPGCPSLKTWHKSYYCPFTSGTFSYFKKWCETLEWVAQLCPTLCDPMDCSPPGSSVHGVLQARVLEGAAIPFSRESSQPRDWTRFSCLAGGFLTVWATREALETLIRCWRADSLVHPKAKPALLLFSR